MSGAGAGKRFKADGRSGAPLRRRRAALVAGASVAIALVAWGSVLVSRRAENRATSSSTTVAASDSSSSPAAASGSDASDPAATTIVPATTTTAAPTTTVPTGPSELRLFFAGDLLPHSPVNAQARQYGRASGHEYDYAPMLAPMAPIISGADLAICHMEVPVHPPGEAPSSYPSFGAPPELVDAVAGAGYDGCSTASNHSLDRGRAGIAATLDRMDQDGVRHNGTARTEVEGGGVATTYDVQGVTVAHLSWAYGFNGYAIPADAPWAVNQIDVDRIHAAAHAARQAGADLVIVSLHWGTEYDDHPSAYQRDVATRLLPSPDIDLVVGHHAHVVQPIEQVGGTYVAFGLGNQLSAQTQGPRRDGLSILAHAVRGADGRWSFDGIEAIPTYVDTATYRVLPVVATLQDPATPSALRRELEASYDRTAAVIVRPFTTNVTLAARP